MTIPCGVIQESENQSAEYIVLEDSWCEGCGMKQLDFTIFKGYARMVKSHKIDIIGVIKWGENRDIGINQLL